MCQISQKRWLHRIALGTGLVFTLLAGCGGGSGTQADSINGTKAPVSESPAVPTVAVQVVRSYPHDPEAFTQGLVFHEGGLYESTGLYGKSSLRKVALETGEVLQRVDLPEQFFAEGIAILGGRIYQVDLQGNGFIYDISTFNRTGSFNYQEAGWGLATDGKLLLHSDGSDVIRFLNPESFETVRTLHVADRGQPLQLLNELEWVRGEIWANVFHQDRIARIDPETGKVTGWLDLSAITPPIRESNMEAVLNGIAFDNETGRIFVTGKLWPELYEISLP